MKQVARMVIFKGSIYGQSLVVKDKLATLASTKSLQTLILKPKSRCRPRPIQVPSFSFVLLHSAT